MRERDEEAETWKCLSIAGTTEPESYSERMCVVPSGVGGADIPYAVPL